KWLDGRNATMAMLCKTAVARKVLEHAWRHEVGLGSAEMYLIDAKASFGASVDACLLVCSFSDSARSHDSTVYGNISAERPTGTIGYHEGRLIADVNAYERSKHLQAEDAYPWRSGIKHDCAKVMELYREGERYRNGFHELVELEGEHVYPMLKGSDVARGRAESPKRWMLVTQRNVGEDTAAIRDRSPRTWEYLQSHADRLNRRGSSIYRKRPPFSIFGVGEYAFAPWKIAISGLHKKLEFVPVGSFAGKPVVLDDTCYFLPCETEREAHGITGLLNSGTAREFFSAFIFWDAKRPVTAEVLRRLDLMALARELGREALVAEFSSRGTDRAAVTDTPRLVQRSLFGAD
ncbi:MAG: SAM-dependent DNA methyltransferase, partial [Planctomycetota bacterium]